MNSRTARSVQASIFDRLFDGETDQTGAQDIDRYRRAVQRDLETLLNARRSWWAAGGRRHLATSSLGFGLPDFTAGLFHHEEAQEALQNAVEDAIRRFEPRLSAVRVAVLERQVAPRRTIRLRIDATLRVAAITEDVTFDTVIDPAAQGVRVRATEESAL